MKKKRIIVLGATGMVGGCAQRLCLDKPEVVRVTSIVRRTTGFKHAKLHEVVHTDFLDYTPIAAELEGYDLALFCVGAYTGAVPDDEFRRITVDYTLAFAAALKASSPNTAFCFLSGQGADPAEKSKVAFARYKGMTENGLIAIGFQQVYIFRPGYIYPVTRRREPNLMYKITRSLYPVLRLIYPNIGISSEDLARVMLKVGLDNKMIGDNPILENKDIREVAIRC